MEGNAQFWFMPLRFASLDLKKLQDFSHAALQIKGQNSVLVHPRKARKRACMNGRCPGGTPTFTYTHLTHIHKKIVCTYEERESKLFVRPHCCIVLLQRDMLSLAATGNTRTHKLPQTARMLDGCTRHKEEWVWRTLSCS
jgi:hypothetical protein